MKFYSKQSQESKSLSDDFKQTLSAAVSITTKPILSKPDAAELEDADPDILEKKREEIRKELELQMKMDSRRIASRKRKHAESSSSSSSSGSDSKVNYYFITITTITNFRLHYVRYNLNFSLF